MGPSYSKLLHFFISFASASVYWSSCYFSFFFSHSLIPLTSRLRINYIPIDWPLEGAIDIHGLRLRRGRCVFHNTGLRPSALHQDFIIYCILCSLKCFPASRASPVLLIHIYAQETASAQNGTDWNLALRCKWVRGSFGSFHFLDGWITEQSSPYENKCWLFSGDVHQLICFSWLSDWEAWYWDNLLLTVK